MLPRAGGGLRLLGQTLRMLPEAPACAGERRKFPILRNALQSALPFSLSVVAVPSSIDFAMASCTATARAPRSIR